MRCAGCGFDNPNGMKFCGECGTALTRGQKAKRGKGERAKKQASVQRLIAWRMPLITLPGSINAANAAGRGEQPKSGHK
jgi:hypothetical protein